MVRLAIHALSEAAVTLLLTTVAAELVHVVSVVRVVVVWVVVWVTAVLGLLVVTLVVALRSRARRKLVAESRVGSVVTAVRRLSVTALLALRLRMVIHTPSESAVTLRLTTEAAEMVDIVATRLCILPRHSIVVRLGIHALSEAAVTLLLTTVAAEFANIVAVT